MVRRLAAALALPAVVAAGCGSAAPAALPPAAEPAHSPPLTARPAGRLIHLGSMPEGVVADGRTGIVAAGLRNPDRLALVDGRRGRVERRVAIPESPRHLALARPGGPVLVPSERANALAEVPLRGGRVHVTAVGAYPHDVAVAGDRVFVGVERGSSVTVVEHGRAVRRFRVALQPGGLAVLDGGHILAVVSVRERVLELFDTRTLARVGRVPAGVGPTHIVSDGRGTLYVVDTTGDALLVFRLRPKLELTRRYALLGAPYGITSDPARNRLWVTLTRTNELVELAAGGRPHQLARFPAPRQPDTVAVDPRTGRVFVTGTADGVLQLLDPRP
jgi:DNA-binding beta-propeller fold protein YncE